MASAMCFLSISAAPTALEISFGIFTHRFPTPACAQARTLGAGFASGLGSFAPSGAGASFIEARGIKIGILA